MKIALPLEDGMICEHFGQAPQFKIFDVEETGINEVQIKDNPAEGHDAIAQFLASEGANAVICSGIGQHALSNLAMYDIEVLPGVSGNPDEVIEKLLQGTLMVQQGCGGGCGCSCSCGGHEETPEPQGGCCGGGHAHEGHSHGGCGCH